VFYLGTKPWRNLREEEGLESYYQGLDSPKWAGCNDCSQPGGEPFSVYDDAAPFGSLGSEDQPRPLIAKNSRKQLDVSDVFALRDGLCDGR
jgi:hypothetical protein